MSLTLRGCLFHQFGKFLSFSSVLLVCETRSLICSHRTLSRKDALGRWVWVSICVPALCERCQGCRQGQGFAHCFVTQCLSLPAGLPMNLFLVGCCHADVSPAHLALQSFDANCGWLQCNPYVDLCSRRFCARAVNAKIRRCDTKNS